MGATPKSLVLDTSFLIAVHNPGDAHHEKSKAILRELDANGSRLVVNTHVFGETVTVLSRYLEREQAIAVGNLLLTDPQVLFVPSSPDLEEQTWTIFREVSKKRTSYADCSVVATVEYTGVRDVLTFDEDDFKPLQSPYRFKIFTLASTAVA